MGIAIVACALFTVLMFLAVLWFSWMFVRHLKTEITWLRGRVDYYQKRGDVALDRMTTLASGQHVDTAVYAPNPHGASVPITADTLEQEVRRMVMGDHEVAHAGQVSE